MVAGPHSQAQFTNFFDALQIVTVDRAELSNSILHGPFTFNSQLP